MELEPFAKSPYMWLGLCPPLCRLLLRDFLGIPAARSYFAPCLTPNISSAWGWICSDLWSSNKISEALHGLAPTDLPNLISHHLHLKLDAPQILNWCFQFFTQPCCFPLNCCAFAPAVLWVWNIFPPTLALQTLQCLKFSTLLTYKSHILRPYYILVTVLCMLAHLIFTTTFTHGYYSNSCLWNWLSQQLCSLPKI